MNIFLDIETIPTQDKALAQNLMDSAKPPSNYKSQEAIDKWKAENAETAWLKTSFDGAYGQICSIAVAIDDGEPVAFFSKNYVNDEKLIITAFFKMLNDAATKNLPLNVTAENKLVFIGHNLINFDLRFLFQRCVVLGIKPPAFIPFDAKAWDKNVFDTMTAWAGLRDTVSLDKLCGVLDAQQKDDLDGSKVWEYVEAGRIEEVAEYNKDDVIRTRTIFNRLTFANVA